MARCPSGLFLGDDLLLAAGNELQHSRLGEEIVDGVVLAGYRIEVEVLGTAIAMRATVKDQKLCSTE